MHVQPLAPSAFGSTPERPFPWDAVLQCWLGAGLLAVVAFPTLRGVDPTIGWLPFWLVLAPALDLAVLRRGRIASAFRAALSRLARLRRSSRRQARPLHASRITRGVSVAVARTQSLMPSRFLSMRRRNSPMMRRYRSSPR
jgi:hypothetical protein